mmetsp:Transcript_146249/g.257793  ORF Transcript_146249/g.257793 Transcript_146249/m.257793 type:complete len:426 (+) Transcript_146249:63-1340(+)
MCKSGDIPNNQAIAASQHVSQRALKNEEFVAQESRVLGHGQCGKVLVATDRNGKEHALKTFRKDSLSAEELCNLKNEVLILRSVEHPHIVCLEHISETAEDLHLVFELLQGGELYTRVAKQGAIQEEEAAKGIHQILQAVAYLHEKGVIHRDIKLENLVYTDSSLQCLKLIDFGLAARWDGRTPLSKRCGTPGYVAPEVWRKTSTNAVDMWALGVLAYEMLLARSPFPTNQARCRAMSQAGQVHYGASFHELSDGAQDFLKSLLVAEPENRLSAKAALEHPWIRAAVCHEPRIAECPTGESCDFQESANSTHDCYNFLLKLGPLTPGENYSSLQAHADDMGILKLQTIVEAIGAIGSYAAVPDQDLDGARENKVTSNKTLPDFLQGCEPQVQDAHDMLQKLNATLDNSGKGSKPSACLEFLAVCR